MKSMLPATAIVKMKREVIETDDRLPFIFQALADPCRYRIFCFLIGRSDICVTDAAKVMDISVPAASQQLRILEMTGLVERERMGQMICYKIKASEPLVRSILKIIKTRS